MEDRDFVNEAIKREWIEFGQAQEAFDAQKKMAEAGVGESSIWDVLVLKKRLTQEQVDTILRSETHYGLYELVEKIGEGVTGEVHRAKKEGTEEIVALRIFPEKFNDTEEAKRFQRETKTVIALEHPGLVRTLFRGRSSERYFAAMTLLEGETLASRLEDGKPLNQDEALRIALQLCNALQALHEAKLVHRDIRPQNVMIDAVGRATLMEPGFFAGKESPVALHYMAPERTTGQEPGIRGDLYALGATLYHMATGVIPFKAEEQSDVLQKVLAHELVEPSEARKGLTPEFDKLVARLTALKPEDRPENPELALAEMERVLSGEAPEIPAAQPVEPAKPRPRPKSKPKPRVDKEPPKPREPMDPKKKLIIGGVAGGAVILALIITLIVVAVSGPDPKPRKRHRTVKKPQPNVSNLMIETLFESHVGSGRFNEAQLTLEREPSLGDKQGRRLKEAIDEAWGEVNQLGQINLAAGQYEQARKRIEEFRPRVNRIPWMITRIEGELARIDSLSKKGREKITTTLEDLDTRVAEQVSRNDLDGAMQTLMEARWEAESDPPLAFKIDDRIAKMRKRIAGARDKTDNGKTAEIEKMFKRALGLFEQRAFSEAVPLLTRILKIDEAHARALGLRGHCYLLMNDWERGREDGIKALGIDPEDDIVNHTLGVLLAGSKPDIAIQHLTKSIEGNASEPGAWYTRAACYLDIGEFEKALADLEEVARLRKKTSNTVGFYIIRIKALTGLKRYEEALDMANAWVDARPRSVTALLERGDIRLAQKEFAEACKDFEKALSLSPNSKRAKKGVEAAQSGRPPTARKEPKPEKKTETKPPPAKKTAKKPKRRPKKVDKRKLIQEQLKAMLHASREDIVVQTNGDIRFAVSYDFSRPEQFKDFGFLGAEEKPGAVELFCMDKKTASVVLWNPKLRGTFVFKCVFRFVGVSTRYVAHALLHTSDVDDPVKFGSGHGLYMQSPDAMDPTQWMMVLGKLDDVQDEILTDPLNPTLVRTHKDESVTLTLSQQGSTVSGFYGSTKIKAENSPPEPFNMRFVVQRADVRLVRFEVTGYFDSAWVHSRVRLPKGDPVTIFDGSSLEGWLDEMGGELRDGGYVADVSKKIGTLVHDEKRSGEAEITMKFNAEEVGPTFGAGFALLTTDGGVLEKSTYILQYAVDKGEGKLFIGLPDGRNLAVLMEDKVPDLLAPGEHTMSVRVAQDGLHLTYDNAQFITLPLEKPIEEYRIGTLFHGGRVKLHEVVAH